MCVNRVLAAVLVLGSVRGAAAQGMGSQDALLGRLKAIAAAHHGRVTLYAENQRTHESVALGADEVVQTASVIKLAVLYEALEQMRAGRVKFADRVTLTKGEQVPGSGMLLLFDAPLELTFKDVLTMMVVVSDNTATNLAIDHLGLAKINARIAELGLKNTYLYKKVFTPVAPGTVMPEDQKKYGLGKTTAREMAGLMAKIVGCELGGPAQAQDAGLCGAAVKMLQTQFYRTGIPRYVEKMPGAAAGSIANKTGALDAVRNDVAAVATKRGMVVIAGFTYENEDRSWGADQEGEMTLARLGEAVVASWSPEGLTGWPAAGEGGQAGK